ncbi:unnamed protein product [Chilo suppressalis]|uniref:Uncharacterized protein n=1 Tax=Chilo suppressalis TaxID=168631 RepID=A0ABN8ARA5_CHISP|nr:unnamed protein product [Chilo suppressalis]
MLTLHQDPRSKADALAKELIEVVDEYAEVGRPENSVDIRVTGLDESITLEELREVVARKGGCSTREVTAGGGNPGPGGMGGTLV